ncbi:hypothetical protein LCGC14_2068130, partial [marine sediment metagenome]
KAIVGRKRNRQRQPRIGGVVGEDTTKQGRRRQVKKDQDELSERARKQLKIPTTKEVIEVERSKSR